MYDYFTTAYVSAFMTAVIVVVLDEYSATGARVWWFWTFLVYIVTHNLSLLFFLMLLLASPFFGEARRVSICH